MRKRQPNVVQFQRGKAEPPVYFIYAGPDEFRLAELMGARHPTFGIQAPWPLAWRDAVANNQTSAFPSMEQLVAPYVAALSSHIGFSPCVLAGHSFAGLMAFETAHQFQRQGGRVDMVILLDTWAKYPTARDAWHKWRQDWKQAPKGAADRSTFTVDWILRNSWLPAWWMLRKARMSFRCLLPKPSGFALTTTLDEQGLIPFGPRERLYKKILESYRPRRLDGRGILFRSEESYSHAFDDSLGWKNLFAGGLEIIPVPGDHHSMFRQHHRALAEKMNEVLKRYWMHPDDNVNDNACKPRRVCTS